MEDTIFNRKSQEEKNLPLFNSRKFCQLLISFFFCLSPFYLYSEQDDTLSIVEEAFPKLPDEHSFSSEVIIASGKGLILLENPNKLLKGKALDHIEGIHFIDLEVPGKKEVLISRLSSAYIDQPITQETIVAIKGIIAKYFKEAHHPLVLIDVPEQDITSGVLQLLVVESRLGALRVEGNTWGSTEKIQKFVGLKTDDQINEAVLIEKVNLMNRNPFRRMNIVYAPGKSPGTTDVILMTKDRFPFRVYGGTDNTGVDSIGRNRWFVGFNWGNVFDLSHLLSYQFTTSYNAHRFKAHTIQYLAPLPWNHILDVYGGFSKVHPKVSGFVRRSKGWSAQESLRYIIPLTDSPFLEHEIVTGFDFKRTNNTFQYTENLGRFGKEVNLSQLVFGYAGNYERHRFRLDFNGNLYCSPGQWLPDQSDKDYNSLRPDAKNHWIYLRSSVTYLQALPKDFSLSTIIRFQIASQNLLPSEQFGLGGYDTVRGYEERELNTDGAFFFSVEGRSPSFSLLKLIRPAKQKVSDEIQFIAFLDYGWGGNHNAFRSEPKADFLLGIGPGIRYTMAPYLTAYLDWGIKLHRQARFGGGGSMLHFGVTASY
jgi:hemolysin activation/secretion protein